MLEQIGSRYDILNRVASGGQGTVYRARDTVLDRVVALKVINQPVAGDLAYVEALQREAKLAARLSHPNITTVYDFQIEDGIPYIVMEFVPDALDRQILGNGRLPWRRAVEIGLQTSLALQHAHDQGVVHRDIKPQNILLRETGAVAVSDFGIARALASSTRSQTGPLRGTPKYMSPEQWEGGSVDSRLDQYGLGIVLYEIITGSPTFQGDSLGALYVQHREALVPPISRSLQVPDEVESVIRKALEKSADDRYGSSAEFADALEAALEGATAQDPMAGVSPSPRTKSLSPTLISTYTPPVFVSKWGTPGDGDAQFRAPHGVAVASDGSVYVADSYNDRIQKFTSDGVFVSKWGTEGAGDGQLNGPVGISVDTDGSVYVADHANNRIQKFTSDGVFVSQWGTQGDGDAQFLEPTGVAVAADGSVYVSESGGNRIQKFTSRGVFVSQWGTVGKGDGEFDFPMLVTVASGGSVYVADFGNNRIQKFTSDGVFVSKWGTKGAGDGEFNGPNGISVDTDGNIYVADGENHRIQKFTSDGVFVSKWGTEGAGDGQLDEPVGISVDTDGSVYVADFWNNRIQKFSVRP